MNSAATGLLLLLLCVCVCGGGGGVCMRAHNHYVHELVILHTDIHCNIECM